MKFGFKRVGVIVMTLAIGVVLPVIPFLLYLAHWLNRVQALAIVVTMGVAVLLLNLKRLTNDQ